MTPGYHWVKASPEAKPEVVCVIGDDVFRAGDFYKYDVSDFSHWQKPPLEPPDHDLWKSASAETS